MAYIELYLIFAKIGLFTIGGGYAAIPLFESEFTGRGQISEQALADMITVAELTPGPFALNAATFIGISRLGLPGGVSAVLGFITFPVIISMILGCALLNSRKPRRAGYILDMLRCGAAGIIASAAVSLISLAVFTGADIIIKSAVLAAMLIALVKFNLNPVLVIIASGIIGVILF